MRTAVLLLWLLLWRRRVGSEARQLLTEIAQEHARNAVPESVRFAEARSQLKAIGAPPGWPKKYREAYDRAVVEQIAAEMALEDQIQDDALALLLLTEA